MGILYIFYFNHLYDVFVCIVLGEFCLVVFYIVSVGLEFVSCLEVAKLAVRGQGHKYNK